MQSIEKLLAEAPAFADLDAAHRELVAGCGRNEVFEANQYLMREGDPATRFYVIRRGHVSMEIFVPERGALTVETIGAGELLGWSWLTPSSRTHLDARATEQTHALSFDATCLRGKFDSDPQLGYELMRRFIPVIVERLMATRVRLLDVYGHAQGVNA